jgi:hypothetical protein
MRCASALVSLSLLSVACAKGVEADKVPLGTTTATQTAAASMPPSAPSGDVIAGTLLEQIAAAPYVYVRLKTANGEVWAAVNEAPLTIGAPVTVYGAFLMEKFESKTLKRNFDKIYFGSLESPNAPAAAMGGGGAQPASTGTPPAVDAKVGKIEKASGADARTIAELWTQKDAMAGKTATIRGKVVKYNPGVMGKNWIHLQDGSGDAAKNTHDITVTSMGETAVGATITITGTVRTNKDFGAGYSYALIVEDAKVVAK